MAWLSGWQYRKKITISGATGAGTNYQVLLKVGENYSTWQANTSYSLGKLVKPTSGSDSFFYECTTAGTSGSSEPTWPTTDGATVTDGSVVWTARKGITLDGHSANFPSGENQGGDLRFCDDDETTLLNFWVRKVTGSSPNRVAYIWVRVADDLGSNRDIYCYFGNSSASNYSNGENTFNFFDDFNDNSFDTNKWVVKWGTANNVVEENGVLKITYNVDPNDLCVQTNTLAQARPFAIEYDVYPSSVYGDGSNWVIGLLYTGATFGSQYRAIYYNNWGYNLYVDNNGLGWQDGTTDLSLGNWYEIKIIVDTSNIKIYRDGIQKGSWSNSTYDNLKIGFGRENNLAVFFDNFRVRKYVYPEPEFSSAGDLETLGVIKTSSFFFNQALIPLSKTTALSFNIFNYISKKFLSAFEIQGLAGAPAKIKAIIKSVKTRFRIKSK